MLGISHQCASLWYVRRPARDKKRRMETSIYRRHFRSISLLYRISSFTVSARIRPLLCTKLQFQALGSHGARIYVPIDGRFPRGSLTIGFTLDLIIRCSVTMRSKLEIYNFVTVVCDYEE
ncbi:hypothetical protein PUN28_005869 [Cardiocondyla obscurior]|uniref:Uncharacterized protein n=1 Tax=Cardiocondyla obscurior TaxID=286306 RepID=A0AAW2G849_9HYME